MNRFIKELHANFAIQYPEKNKKNTLIDFSVKARKPKKLTLQV